MKPYIVCATDARGRRDTFARAAASIEHLRMLLERQGYSDIEFVDDEHAAELRQKWWQPEERPQTPRQVRFHATLLRGHTNRLLLVEAVRNNRIAVLVGLGMIAYGLYLQRLGWVLAGCAGLIVLSALIWRNLATSKAYNELLRAHALGELDKVEELTRKLRASPAIQAKKFILLDLEFRQAVTLARRGRLDEGLQRVEHLRDDPALTKGMYESRTASIYYAAGRLGDFVRLMGQAYEASEHAQLQALDLAFTHARFGAVDKARQLLATILPANLTATHRGIFLATRGVCWLRERNSAEASCSLSQAVDTLRQFSGSPATWPFQGIIAGYAAIALSANGERDRARELLAPWKDVALACTDPLARKLILAEGL
jgi:hypothetical protein